MKRFLIVFSLLSVSESLVLLLIFRSDALPYLVYSISSTLVFLPLLIRLWHRLPSPWLGLGACLLASWIMLQGIVVFAMLITPDPFAAERIAEKSWLLYVLIDKVARGLVFGIFFASIAYVWAWVPVGVFCYLLLRWAHGEK